MSAAAKANPAGRARPLPQLPPRKRRETCRLRRAASPPFGLRASLPLKHAAWPTAKTERWKYSRLSKLLDPAFVTASADALGEAPRRSRKKPSAPAC